MTQYGRYAAIDIGTVTCRLLIADANEFGISELAKGYGITNLGEGVDATSCLKPEAMQRVCNQLKLFKHEIAHYQKKDASPITVITMATSASRDAKNSADFIALLDEIGIYPNIIPGSKEAALSFRGVCADFPHENLLVIDIGGGSTELSAGSSDAEPRYSCSFDVGCRRVTERFIKHDPPSEDELTCAFQWIKEELSCYFNQLANSNFCVDKMVAVAGTATSVVSIHKKMKVYDSAQVHKSIVTRDALDEVFLEMNALTLDQRKKVIGLDPGRAEVIIAGLMVLQVAMDFLNKKSFTVSESDILQGIILDAVAK